MPHPFGGDSAGLAPETDALAAVAAHRAINSLAFIAGALAVLQQGVGIGPEDEQELLGRAIKHAGLIDAVLRDLVLGLPIGFTPVVEIDPTSQAARRFGLGRGGPG